MRSLQVLMIWLALASMPVWAEPMPPVDSGSPLYEVRVEPGVSYDDVVTSLNSAAQARNFVSPATFPLDEHIKNRGLAPEGVLETRAYCNLGLGAEILLDHPEFAVFVPCRIAIYQKQKQLYMVLARPSYDLQYIKNPTERARKAARQLEETLIWMLDMARKGEI